MRQTASMLVVLSAAALLAGCGPNEREYLSSERMNKGLVLILPGIEGPSPNNAAIRRGLDEGGVEQAIQIYDWAGFGGGARHAINQERSRRTAHGIAELIARYRATRPGRPVAIVGHSGGGAMAVFVAEAVAERARDRGDALLNGIITLAPALSPTYDLTAALAGCDGRMLNCHTDTDVVLRTMTTLVTNFDGVPGETAGQSGFKLPAPPASVPEPRRRAFQQLRQIAWDATMAKHGNLGGHTGWTSPPWVARTLAPVLREWMAQRSSKG